MEDIPHTHLALEDMMRRAGVKISAGRLLILRALAGARRPVAAQDIETLLADADDLDLLAVGQKPADMVAGETRDLRIEAAAQAALALAPRGLAP